MVSASLRCTNGVEVSVGTTGITLHEPGPRAGQGPKIRIPLKDWELLATTVERVREAIEKADRIIAAERQP